MSDAIDLRVDGIELRRAGRTILQSIDLAVSAGRIAALTGPSGSGKTSLLTVLAAAESADRGTVTWDGTTITPRTRGPWTGRVQLAHQSFGLLSLLTAAENVELALQGMTDGRRPPRGRLRSAAREALNAVGLAVRANNRVEELSGGEQQRVGLARALVTDPDLLLADEPTAQLDPEVRQRIIELLVARAHEGTTVIVATHDEELSARCDPVFRLRDGFIAYPEERPERQPTSKVPSH